MWKMLTDVRGPLQGVSVEAIVRTAYGPDAKYVEDPEGVVVALIKRGDQTLDSVIEAHETIS